MRLAQAAHIARKGKFDAFSTTLLVSKYQKHDLIRQVGEAMGEKYGVPFLYRDFRLVLRKAASCQKIWGCTGNSTAAACTASLNATPPKKCVN
jgi:predicted adenine nucleotide alpha hydrolase (AANH) superfamily ATPase